MDNKTYLERHFPEVPEDLMEIGGEIFVYRDFTNHEDKAYMTNCRGPADQCIHWQEFYKPRPCGECVNMCYTRGSRKLFHDTGDAS